jgi:ornithine carbamoyltransferase
MSISLKGRSLLTLRDYSKEEIEYLLDLAKELKIKKHNKIQGDLLMGKNIVLIFEKTSTRTRCAFEVAAYDEGANVTFLTNSQMGKKESVEDTARVLGRFYDGIEFRGFMQKTAEDLAKHSGVPVWNGLTDFDHPTQALADMLTVKENIAKPYNDIKLVYSGDGRNNVANALLIICAKLGVNFTVISPPELMPEKWLVDEMRKVSQLSGGSITLTSDPVSGVRGADVIYTDIWVSMGEEDQIKQRIDLLLPYQVNMQMIKNSGNDNVIFLHCLPSFHNRETQFGEMVYEKHGIAEMEVTDEVFKSKYSKVFDEAENRMHTIKAVMCATMK